MLPQMAPLILHSQTSSGYDGVPIVRNYNAQIDSNKWWEYVVLCHS